MGSNEIDINEIQDEVFDYRPLLSEEAEQNELRKSASLFFSGNEPYSRSTFYGGGQETLLNWIRTKAEGIHHVTCGRFADIDEPERGLIKYYKISIDGVRKIGVPSNESECIRMKFILDTARLLLLYGLLHANQFIPFRENKEGSGDKYCLDRYVVSKMQGMLLRCSVSAPNTLQRKHST